MPADDMQRIAHWISKARAANARGRHARAAEFCAKAVKARPDVVEGWYNLALAQRGMGRHDRALQALRRARDLSEDAAEALNAIGLEFLQCNADEEAERCLVRAVELAPGLAIAHANLGMALGRSGRNTAAREACYRAAELEPGSAPIQLNLAGVLVGIGDFAAAEVAARRAVALDPGNVAAHLNLAAALEGSGHVAAACDACRAALAGDPASAAAHHNLALMLSALGNREEAIGAYEKALELDPDHAATWHALATLHRFTPGDPMLARLERRLAALGRDGDAESRMALEFALGKAHDDLGAYPAAFAHFARGNALQRRLSGYAPAADDALFRRLLSACPGPLGTSPPRAVPRPLFIVGLPRSGTTLVEQILASHAEVHGAGELTELERLAAPLYADGEAPPPRDEVLLALRETYLARIASLADGCPVVTDKMPLNFRWIGCILAALPEATIVHVKRDPVATAWSLYRHHFASRGNGFACDMDDIVRYHELYSALMAAWHTRFPGRIHDLDYDALTESQEVETRRLLTHCDLPWDPACLAFHETARAVTTASSGQVRRPLYRGSSLAWQAYADLLEPWVARLAGVSIPAAENK